MGTDWYLVTVESDAELEPLLRLLLTRATAITALSQATAAEWDGMANCVMISSFMDLLTRELVRAWAIPSGPLWQYELLQDGKPFFRAADFSAYMLRANNADLTMIQLLGISTELWARVNLTGSVTAQPLTELDLKALKDELDPPE